VPSPRWVTSRRGRMKFSPSSASAIVLAMSGQFYALRDVCGHRNAPLSRGKLMAASSSAAALCPVRHPNRQVRRRPIRQTCRPMRPGSRRYRLSEATAGAVRYQPETHDWRERSLSRADAACSPCAAAFFIPFPGRPPGSASGRARRRAGRPASSALPGMPCCAALWHRRALRVFCSPPSPFAQHHRDIELGNRSPCSAARAIPFHRSVRSSATPRPVQ